MGQSQQFGEEQSWGNSWIREKKWTGGLVHLFSWPCLSPGQWSQSVWMCVSEGLGGRKWTGDC